MYTVNQMRTFRMKSVEFSALPVIVFTFLRCIRHCTEIRRCLVFAQTQFPDTGVFRFFLSVLVLMHMLVVYIYIYRQLQFPLPVPGSNMKPAAAHVPRENSKRVH